MAFDFDFLIIGSGFGGSITAYNLSKAGHRVCVLERGQEWPRGTFPRGSRRIDGLFWDPEAKQRGPIDYRKYDGIDVTVGAGVGGGSLIYSGFLIEPPDSRFAAWQGGIRKDVLAPHYARVKQFLGVERYPFDDRAPYSDTNRVRVMKEATRRTGRGSFDVTDLAMDFMKSPDEWGTTHLNQHGAIQMGCIMCGECNVGCRYHAKSTLDVNYLFVARKQGVEVRANHAVDRIEPLGSDGGYRVIARDLSRVVPESVALTARKVVVSAGTLGSTELLLRNRDVHGTLPHVSRKLGHGFSGNGNSIALLFGMNEDVGPVEPERGPSLVLRIEYDKFFLEDTGVADFVAWYLDGIIPDVDKRRMLAAVHRGVDALREAVGMRPSFGIIRDLEDILRGERFVSRTTYLISVGQDPSVGTLELDGNGALTIDWNEDDPYHQMVRDEVHSLAGAMGGQALSGKTFSFHLLGGCHLADSESSGVVDKDGQVFGHPGLYVIDGAIVPYAIGVNPALTISALSDMLSERLANAT